MSELQALQDKLDSAHARLDSFYAWAAQLQKEFRDMKNRLSFIEAQAEISASAGEEVKKWKESKVNPLAAEEEKALLERLARITSASITQASASEPR